MEEYTEIKYNIWVEHKLGTFDSDMDISTTIAKEACQRLKYLKRKYHGYKINIEKITKTTTHESISESALEKIAKNN
jgi:hypothetical protein